MTRCHVIAGAAVTTWADSRDGDGLIDGASIVVDDEGIARVGPLGPIFCR